MKYILRAQEMKAYDRDTSERIGIPSMVLMERAALAVQEAILEEVSMPERVLVVAGMGNNGGDGLAIGRMLALKGADVTFYMAGNPAKMTQETKNQVMILKNLGFSIQSKLEMREYDMVVDALFGIGLSGNLDGEYLDIIKKINCCGSKGTFVCAVDIPSGICADTGKILGGAVRANLTVTFAFAKRGHLFYPGREYAGRLITKDIGITEQSFIKGVPGAFCYEYEDLKSLMPERRPDGNKGTFGKVLLMAGSLDMSGACILCGSSILRTGAGMVKIVTPSCNREIIQKTLPEAMLYTYEERPDEEQIQKSVDWADVIVAGPGIGMDKNAYRLIQYALEKKNIPVVMDADGLNLIAAHKALWNLAAEKGKERLIITPHPGELVRLAGTDMEMYRESREALILELAQALNCIIAAKDAATIVAQSGRKDIYINHSGNDGMATAGSGDVLAGMIGGLLAQGMDSFGAVCLGVYLHGLAGDKAAVQNGRMGMVASDMIKVLPLVYPR